MNISVLLTKYKKKSVKPFRAKITYISDEAINEILSLHPIIKANLKDEDTFYFDNYDFYKSNLEKGGKLLGCSVNGRLIAYSVIIFPGYSGENLGYDLNLNENELPFVAHLDSYAVHPDYMGNKLQLKFCKLMQEIALNNGCKYLCATAAPSNEYSLKNLLDFGFKVELHKLKYDGKLRYILCKSIKP